MPKEITLKIKIPTGAEITEVVSNALSRFGELVKVEIIEEPPASTTDTTPPSKEKSKE